MSRQTNQPDLFGSTATSAAAAQSMFPHLAECRRLVFESIRRAGKLGRTDEEVQLELGMVGNTQRPRRSELVESGLIVNSGSRRKTSSGRLACVWVVAARRQ